MTTQEQLAQLEQAKQKLMAMQTTINTPGFKMPTVVPGPSPDNTLKNSMTSDTTKTSAIVPPVIPPPVPEGGYPQPNLFGSKAPAGSEYTIDSLLTTAMDRLNSNNDLLTQKQLLIKAIYDAPLTPEELAKFPANLQAQLRTYNPNTVDPITKAGLEMQLRLTNDQIAGRTSTFNQSIKFLSESYTRSMTSLQTQKKDAIAQIEKAIATWGSHAFDRMTSAQKREIEAQAGYPSGYLDNLPLTTAEAAAQVKPVGPSSYQEWSLAGGEAGTGMTYAQYLKQGVVGTQAVSPYQEERAVRTVQSVDELLKKAKDNPGIFGRTAALPIPDYLRSDAYRNFSSSLNTLISNITYGELTAMREASKTGGALGQVSDREGKLLGDSLGSLQMSQSPAEFQAQLQKIKDSINRWRAAMGASQLGTGTPAITSGQTSSGLKFTIEP